MNGENISPLAVENQEDPFDLDIELYPVSSDEDEAFMTLPDTSILTHTACTTVVFLTLACV